MFEHYPPLHEFIEPLPICQPETDLGNMLSIFQHLNCKMLAIYQGELGWGVLRAEDLLSVVTEAWLGDRLALTSHPRNITYQQNLTSRLIPDVKHLIRPAMVYQGEIKLNEFLNQLQCGYLTKSEIWLIINQQGELQGRLDRDKVIKYLALETSSTLPQLPPSLNYLKHLLEAIALPSKLETETGQLIHANQLWQQLITAHPSEISPIPSSEIDLNEMTKLWINEQQVASSNSAKEHKVHLDFSLAQKLKIFEDDLSTGSKGTNWKFLQIPLAGESYYLVIAIATSSLQPLKNSALSSSADPTQQILATATHELKSPLTGILGLSSLLQGEKLGSLNQRQARYIELIYRSGKKMMNLVDDLIQLTALIAEQPKDLESINLELLCSQLYQDVLFKVHSPQGKLDLTSNSAQLKITVEPGKEMAIANKLLLSSILSNLMLEVVKDSETIEPLQIEIKSASAQTAIQTAIVINSQALSSLSNSGLNFLIAEYLSTGLEAKVTQTCSKVGCQLTLLLPPGKEKVTPQPSMTNNNTANLANLTILCLYPELEVIDPQVSPHDNTNFDLKNWSDDYGKQSGYQHRIIEADSLEQAHNLARIWQLDAIILNGYQIAQPRQYLRSLQESEHLASLPLITLDVKTTEAANQIEGLNVYPCLLSAQQCNLESLIQVIQIALES